MDDGLWLYYKLPNEPKGSGELKTSTHIFRFSKNIFKLFHDWNDMILFTNFIL